MGPRGTAYRNFFHHLHPLRVRTSSLRPTATFGLGVIGVALFLILVATGVLLMLHYVPSTDPAGGAYASMLDLRHAVPFGRLVRNMHRWAAHGLVAVAFLHMCRVFFRGAFKPPRRTNWLIGVGLLVLTLAESFTGYLLPWDQLSYWAAVVGTNLAGGAPVVGRWLRLVLLGGNEVSQATLVRFYALHVFVLPLGFGVLLALHLWRVRTDGGLAHRSENEGAAADGALATVASWPHVVLRELAVFLGCLVVVTVAAFVFDAPLGEPANPAHAPEPAKAAWYFLWLQELVSYDYGPLAQVRWPPWDPEGAALGAEFWGGVLLPAVCLAVLCLIPYAARARSRRRGIGIYFAPGRRAACVVFALAMLGIVVLTVVGYFFRGPNWALTWGH